MYPYARIYSYMLVYMNIKKYMINYPVENNKNRRLIFLCNKKISSTHFQMLQTSYSLFSKMYSLHIQIKGHFNFLRESKHLKFGH
jgi:hypothetical protein